MSAPPPAELPPKPSRLSRLGWLACVLVATLIVRHQITVLLVLILAWLLHRVIFQRDRKLLACIISSAISIAAFEFVGGRVLERQIAEKYHPDIDHRLKPDAALGINHDGIRCPVEADN